jgi:4-hydroxy-3-polyprenylbenzoate decarboxylase
MTDAKAITPNLQYEDLREWLALAEEMGEVKRVKGLSWQQEIGMAAEVVLHEESAPCIIFEDVPGTLPGSRVLVNFFGGDRQKMTLGFPHHLNKLELSEAFRTNYMADLKRIPPVFVNDGPIFENVMKGEDVDVTKFPTPMWHP